MESKLNSKALRVKPAFKELIGKEVVNIDPEIMKDLDLKKDDIIEISAPTTTKKTAAHLLSGRVEDNNSNSIRLDYFSRRNLGVEIDDSVEIQKIDIELAEQVIFAGYPRPIFIKNSNLLADKLKNHLVTKDDIFSFRVDGHRIDLRVINYYPWGNAVKIHKNTEIICLKQ